MHLIIRNVGPIKDINIELNKINVFIGPQSCGKSTINKIACYLSWVEKTVSLDQSFDFFYNENSFCENLETFHNMNGYLNSDSFISYESDILKITYRHNDIKIPSFQWKDRYAYLRPTVSYIPAERNIISIIPNLTNIKLPNNNIKYYLKDWTEAREIHREGSPLSIASLNISYQFDPSNNNDKDYIYISEGEEKKLELSYTSSGIQSLVPLYVILEYFQGNIGKELPNLSIDEAKRMKELEKKLEDHIFSQFTEEERNLLKNDFVSYAMQHDELNTLLKATNNKLDGEKRVQLETLIGKLHKEFIDLLSSQGTLQKQKEIKAEFDKKLQSLRENYLKNHYLKIFLEEPETNAFPSTQTQVMYDLLRMTKMQSETSIMITTHSPYILYALNNCMLGGQITDNVAKEDINEFGSARGWIEPSKVSVWQVKEGILEDIKDQDLQIIGSHYFSNILGLTMNEYNRMLKYFTVKK